jgi:hypothetical protein
VFEKQKGAHGLEIQCATLNKLVERLTFPDYNAEDKVFMKIFIATYEDFTSPQKLLKKLTQRFRVPKKKMDAEAMQQIQSRVCSVLKVFSHSFIYSYSFFFHSFSFSSKEENKVQGVEQRREFRESFERERQRGGERERERKERSQN